MASTLILIVSYQKNIKEVWYTRLFQLFADSWRNQSSEVSLAEKPFPLFFIDNCIHKFLNKLFIKHEQDSTTTQKKEITISLENLGKISLLAKRQLTDIFRSCCKDIKLNVVFKISNRLRNAFRFKDQLPKCIN